MLTQDQIDKLDRIGELNGLRLHMPPFNNMIHPFFVIRKKDGYPRFILDDLISFKIRNDEDREHYYIVIEGKSGDRNN